MLQKSQNYQMNQNYNSLLSPKKRLGRNDFQLKPPKAVQYSAGSSQTLPKSYDKVVKINSEHLNKEIQLFNWRSRTSLPILKIAEYSIYPLVHPFSENPIFKTDSSNNHSPNKSKEEHHSAENINSYLRAHPEVASYELRIKTEDIRCTLQDIEMLPIPQVIYLLKELLIGFEVLIDIFGLFDPSAKMIIVNQRQQWKVWINQDYIANTKQLSKKTEKEFLYNVIKFVEDHSLSSSQSKHLFQMLKETTYQHQCSFIKILEKINQFVAVNKIFHVNKVLFTSERVISRESYQNHSAMPSGSSGYIGDSLKLVKSDLQKIVAPVAHERKMQNQQGSTLFASNNKSTNNLMDRNNHTLLHSPSYSNLQNNQKNHIKTNQTINFNVFSPTSPNYSIKEEKGSEFDRFCDNWDRNQTGNMMQSKFMSKMHPPPVDFSQIIYSPNHNIQFRPSVNPKHSTNIKQTSTIVPPEMKRTTLTNTSPAKNRKEMKQIVNQNPKPVSRFEQSPIKRNNRRKYSEQIVQMKSLDHLSRKQKCGHISNIYNPNDQIRSFNKIHEAVMVATPTPKTITKVSYSPDVKCISSPNNSSSTKQIQQSGEIKSNYIKLKMKDLGGDKPKNNQSVINSYSINNLLEPQSKKDKNMAVSYQFQSKDCDKSSDSERSLKKANARKKETKWSNKISGLFSDNLSIKHLKESIKIKTKEEQRFQKEYLKDVKLDLLQKFGRKANHIVEEDDGRYLNAQYKSMQLIEEELEEGKSYLEDDQKFQDFPKDARSKNLTMQVSPNMYQHQQKRTSLKDCNSEYDDNDLDSQISSSNDGGFNFQTEMYVINRPQ